MMSTGSPRGAGTCASGSVQCNSISLSSSSWLYTVPMSRPTMQSSANEIGYAIGNSKNLQQQTIGQLDLLRSRSLKQITNGGVPHVNILTTGMRVAPMRSPCRVHIDCGMICKIYTFDLSGIEVGTAHTVHMLSMRERDRGKQRAVAHLSKQHNENGGDDKPTDAAANQQSTF